MILTAKEPEKIFGEWLPEPVSLENAEANRIQEQTAEYALLVLIQNLNRKERTFTKSIKKELKSVKVYAEGRSICIEIKDAALV